MEDDCGDKECDFYDDESTFNCGNLLMNFKACEGWLRTRTEPVAASPLQCGVMCDACEPLGEDYIITGTTTRPGQGIIGITILQKWNNKLILLEKVCEQERT